MRWWCVHPTLCVQRNERDEDEAAWTATNKRSSERSSTFPAAVASTAMPRREPRRVCMHEHCVHASNSQESVGERRHCLPTHLIWATASAKKDDWDKTVRHSGDSAQLRTTSQAASAAGLPYGPDPVLEPPGVERTDKTAIKKRGKIRNACRCRQAPGWCGHG